MATPKIKPPVRISVPATEITELRANLNSTSRALTDALAELNAANRKIEGKDLHIKALERALERAENDHQMQASNAGAFQRQYGDTLRRLEGVLDLISHEPGEVTRITKGKTGGGSGCLR